MNSSLGSSQQVSLDPREEFIYWYLNTLERHTNRKHELESDIRFLRAQDRSIETIEMGGMNIAQQNQSMQMAMNFGSYLTVMAVEARNLAPLDLDGTSDPYVVLMLEDNINQTSYVPNTVNPIWKETFQFPIIRGHSGVLEVIVKDHDSLGYDGIQGVTHIRLNSRSLQSQLKVDREFNLKRATYYEPERIKK